MSNLDRITELCTGISNRAAVASMPDADREAIIERCIAILAVVEDVHEAMHPICNPQDNRRTYVDRRTHDEFRDPLNDPRM